MEGSPGYLTLGRTISLLGDELPTGGFQPTDEGLEGFDDDEDELGDGFGFPSA